VLTSKLSSVAGPLVACFGLLLSVSYLNYNCAQSEFIKILCSYGVAFLCYGYFLQQLKQKENVFRLGVLAGLFIRIILLFAFPQLSDDIYPLVDNYLTNLYGLLNSPDYFTIYPPLSQVVFYLATLSDGWSLAVSAGVIKLVLLLSDCGILFLLIRLLKYFDHTPIWSLVYFINPLVMTEVGGQLHFESLMVFFLAAAQVGLQFL